MSNIGKKPVKIESGATVTIQEGKVVVTGSKGTLEARIPTGVKVNVSEDVVTFEKENESRELEKFVGLVRALVANNMIGVSKGFDKKLELSGVGYRAKVEGQEVVLNVGFANPVRLKAPEGVTVSIEEGVITVSGINKNTVGDFASDIRKVRPPDPYKGKGIKYLGEKLRRKVGKAAKAVGAAK